MQPCNTGSIRFRDRCFWMNKWFELSQGDRSSDTAHSKALTFVFAFQALQKSQPTGNSPLFNTMTRRPGRDSSRTALWDMVSSGRKDSETIPE
jgi:hypothetical protein